MASVFGKISLEEKDKGIADRVKSKIKQYQKKRLTEKRRALSRDEKALSEMQYADVTATEAEEVILMEADESAEQQTWETEQDLSAPEASFADEKSVQEADVIEDQEDAPKEVLEEEATETSMGDVEEALPWQDGAQEDSAPLEDATEPTAGLAEPTDQQENLSVGEEDVLQEEVGVAEEQAVEEDGAAEKETENTEAALAASAKRKKGLKYSLIALASLVVIYGALALFFQSHFYFGTKVNGVDVSGKSAQAASEAIGAKAGEYTLEVMERGGATESLQGAEIDLRYEGVDRLEALIAEQKYYNWVVESVRKENAKSVPMTFDDAKLQGRVDQLKCLLPENTVKPANPRFVYQDGTFIVVAEDRGKEVDRALLYTAVSAAMGTMEPQLDIDAKGCYVEPAFNVESQETKDIQAALNRYITSQITYHIGDQTFVLDGSRTSQWLNVDENYQIAIDRAGVDAYVQEMMAQYRKLKRSTSFTTTGGSRIVVNGGDYNGVINKGAEADFLIAAIQKGEASSRDLNNLGNTYVEISLSGQRLWFYKNGTLIVESSIVSGNVRRGYATPKGVYSLKYKQRNVTLKGEDYETPVSFWMPFNGIVGMHDATWRSRFGGSIYIADGSHSCINLPYSVARTIYNNIDPGTPIVCY